MNREKESEIINKKHDIIGIVGDILRLPIDAIIPESRLSEDLKADSLDIVEIMMAIEAKYDYDIPDEEANKMSTIRDIIDYIELRNEPL